MVAGLHLLALWSFAVAAPLLALLGDNPDFLAFRHMSASDIVLFALALALAPPLLLFALEAVIGLASSRAARALHLFLVAALSTLIAARALKKLGADGTALMIVIAVAGGVAVAVLYARLEVLRTFLTVLAAAALVFLGAFLFESPASDLVFPGDVQVSTARVGGDVPVVMVVFDEVSTVALLDAHERIDAALFPNLSSLAHDATWFRYATASTDETRTAIPALLTGNVGDLTASPILSKHPHNLFTFLGRSYQMQVSQEAGDLCPRTACNDVTRGSLASRVRSLASDTGLVYLHVISPRAVERDLPSVSDTLGDFAADTATTKVPGSQLAQALAEIAGHRAERFLQIVQTIRPGGGRVLYYKHTLIPHIPFEYLPSGRSYTASDDPLPGLGDERSWGSRYLLEQAYQRHLLQMQFGDFLLGVLLRRLRADDVYDRALIVVTADGGESFLHPADRNRVTQRNVEDIAATPLLIKAPGERRGRIVDRHVRLLDVLPTIADLLHTDLPWKTQGHSLWNSRSNGPRDVRILQTNGHPVVLGFEDFQRRLRASVQRKLRVFAPGGGPVDLFGLGPNPELLGRSLSELDVTRSDSASAQLTDPSAYDRVDLDSAFVPAHLTGEITAGPSARDLAFAVNGRIVGVAPSFKLTDSDSEQFSVLVPETAFHDGRNSVDVLWVKRVGSAPSLQRIGGTG
jgi:Sulfatase